MPSFEQIERLVLAVRTGSFTQAARELSIQPQTVSKTITELENKVGFALFTHNGGTMVPTQDCLLLVESAEVMLSARHSFRSTANRIAQRPQARGRLSLALATQPYRGCAVRAGDFDSFRRRNPEIHLEILEMENSSCLVALEQGKVDAAILLGPIGTAPIRSVRLYSHRVVAMLSRSHRLTECSALTIADLAQTEIAYPSDFAFCIDRLELVMRKHSLALPLVKVRSTPEDIARFLARGGALFVFDDPSLASIYPDAVFIPLARDNALDVPLHLALNADRDVRLFPFIETFAQALAKSRMLTGGHRP